MAKVGSFPPYNLASGHHPSMGSSAPKLGKNLNPRANRPPFVTNTVSLAAEFASQVPVNAVPNTIHHIPVSNDEISTVYTQQGYFKIWRVMPKPSLHLGGSYREPLNTDKNPFDTH